MTDPTNIPPPPAVTDPNRAPTFAEMQQLASQAANAVASATSAAEAATSAAAAIREGAGKMNLAIPDEVVKAISDSSAAAVIAQLRQVGALTDDGQPAGPAGPGGPALPAALPAGTVPPTGAPATPPPPAAVPPGGDPPPGKRKTFADKFLGL